ncbi:LOW QUALITY PROTEIN: Reverse transcriptase [Phytophthora palmivora]|uniref:RNA-directed DNA polymerase n=1 Tax=Phytophthora palmivora TaxID=4796 RepID=A0A2P4XFS3_9STRA|nr:LOW QUALITY PROTEIN: Reverse transcriptase [Phytophthora palmivora]
MGKCPMEEFYNQIRQWFNPAKHTDMLPESAERIYCIYAFVNKKSVDQGSKNPYLRGNTYDLTGNRAVAISSVRQVDDYSRSEVTMTGLLKATGSRYVVKQEDIPVIRKSSQIKEIRRSEVMDLLPGQSRGYWKHYAPGKLFRQAKIAGKINNERGILLLDIGAEVSIVDTAFARKVGCYIDTSQIQDCVGIGESVYRTEGRTRIEITMAGSLVYVFDIWVGDLAGQDAILGMDFMVPAGTRLDLAYGSINLPDEVRIQLSGRRQLYSDKARLVTVGEHIQIGQSAELQLHLQMSDHEKFWVTRGDRLVTTVAKDLGKRRYLQITNVSDKAIILQENVRVGIWLAGDHVPRMPGFVSVGSRRYMEWQNLALEATVEGGSEQNEILMGSTEPMVDRPSYPAPRAILKRPEISQIQVKPVRPIISGNRSAGSDPDPSGKDRGPINPTTDEVKIEDTQVGDPEIQTTAEIEQLRQRIWKYRHLLFEKGNALPPAARGVVCDIDVGEAKPIAQRVRKIAPRFCEKLSDLIKGLLSAKMISYSRSSWALPIVVIVKKNAVDIRLCIDYRLINSLTQLMVYPMPVINDLLEDLDKGLWYCSLDMASGFWVVTMTDRARAISAFITPFGLFEWNRMPLGLKNAPQIYQRLTDNALYGFTRIPPPDRIQDPQMCLKWGKPMIQTSHQSYIDDIILPADSCDQLCDRVDTLREACDKCNLLISVGMSKVEYLGHRVSKDRLEANPKDLKALTDLAFPGSLRSTQSFLVSLNYYSRFIEDYASYAAVQYELRDVDFAAMSKEDVRIQIERCMEHTELDQLDRKEDPGLDLTLESTETSDPEELDSDRLIHNESTHKSKIASTSILRHLDAEREAVVIVYASDSAISAALVQEYDQTYYPITFVSRKLKSNELNYSPVEKEVLALLRILDLGYNMLVGRRIRVLTKYSTLAWLFRSTGLQERLGQWASMLSPWTLEIVKCVKGEEEILGVIAASITPRSRVDEALIQISPKKEPRRKIQAPIPVIRVDEELYVFDGSARVKRGGGAYRAILWKLPEWTVIKARSAYAEDLTVNEAAYCGLLLCLDLLSAANRKRMVFCGDSNLVIRQVRGEIDCKAPGLTLLKQRGLEQVKEWPDHELVHVKRDWNGSADSLASATLQRQGGVEIESDEDKQDLNYVEQIERGANGAAQITAVVTRSGMRSTTRTISDPQSLREEFGISESVGPNTPKMSISEFKKYLNGDLQDLTQQEAKSYANLVADYDLDHQNLLFYCPSTRSMDADRDKLMRLVIVETLYQDILHHYHVSLEGGHQGFGRTYQRIRDHFHWRGLYKSVQRYVGECVDCETGKSKSRIQGDSPGNIQTTYPFQIIAMDHIPSLTRSS